MSAAERPAARVPFGLIVVLSVVVFGASTLANLPRLTGYKAVLPYLPPYRAGRDASMVDHLGGEYLCIARAIASGRGFSDPFHGHSGPTAWMPPVYPLLLAALLFVNGGDLGPTSACVVLLQNLTLVLTGYLVLESARRTSPLRHAGAIALAIYLGLVIYHFHSSFQFTHDSWIILLFVDILFMAALRMGERPSSAKAAMGWGVLGGLSAQVSPVLGLVWAAESGRQAVARRGVRPLAIALLAALATTAPWMIRNYVNFHRLIPVKSNLYFELYQSAVLEPDGVLRYDTGATHPYRGSGLRERLRYKEQGEIAYVEGYRQRFLAYLRDDPAGFLRKVANRLLAATFLYHPFSSEEDGIPLMVSYAVHPLPFNALLAVCFAAARPWPPARRVAVLINVVYLVPYVIVAYYERYAFPLIGVQAMICFWACEALFGPPGGRRGGQARPRDDGAATGHDQNASAGIASPPATDPSALQTAGAIPALTGRTEPSPSSRPTAAP